jgi:hypothetical protein
MAWKRASMAAALGYRPDPDTGGVMQARLCFHLQADSYDTDSLIGVLEQLTGFYAGQKVVLLWDGLSSHWSYQMRAHLEQQRGWLTVERLPAYAPELNPAKYLWANLKGGELANCTGDTSLRNLAVGILHARGDRNIAAAPATPSGFCRSWQHQP